MYIKIKKVDDFFLTEASPSNTWLRRHHDILLPSPPPVKS